jgi:hypothetical protein
MPLGVTAGEDDREPRAGHGRTGKEPGELRAPRASPVELALLERALGVFDQAALRAQHLLAVVAQAASDATRGDAREPRQPVQPGVERGGV